MICTAVPRNAVDIVWSDVSGMLYKAIQTSKGKYHIDDIYNDLTKGYYDLWLIIDDKSDDKVIAAITTRLIQYPNRKAMLKMISDPDYIKSAQHRVAGLAGQLNIETKVRNNEGF